MGEEKKSFDLKEVAQHKAQDDCWMVIHGKVKKLFKYVGSIGFSSSSF
jgi:cytochrome b involved in lipid metabolism